ncbi:MAG: helix-turn-helix domain-containing protein [Gammaproteobacteria bacterium]|nr:helix-turn-helix domain-containing protein [Gammaproteobacteria bacterium]
MDYVTRTPKQLAQALKAHRAISKASQQDVGRRVGLLPKTISALESTPERSSVESLFKLLSALGLELVLREKTAVQKSSEKSEW